MKRFSLILVAALLVSMLTGCCIPIPVNTLLAPGGRADAAVEDTTNPESAAYSPEEATQIVLDELGITEAQTEDMMIHYGEYENQFVYSIAFSYNGKDYEFIVSGETGKILLRSDEIDATTATTAPVETTAPVSEHEAQIQQIRSWYQGIVNSPNLQTTTYGTSATVYRLNGQVVSIAEYIQLDTNEPPAAATVHYYYHNGTPFFVFIEYEHYTYEEVRLYFVNGQLIRWIIDDNSPKDNVANAQWQAYYTNAVNALNAVS